MTTTGPVSPAGPPSPPLTRVSSLYREGQHSLYVNDGIGFVGLPIRIQCPPEISRFRLVRSAA